MNENILAAIAEKTKERIREERRKIPLFEMRNNAEAVAAFGTGRQNRPTFYQALAKPGMSFICEVKKASPSKGVIAEDFPYLQIAGEYEAAGAAAISCLTEPYYFQGSDRYLKQIASTYQSNRVILSDGRGCTIVMLNQNALSRPIVQFDDKSCLDLSTASRDLYIKAVL